MTLSAGLAGWGLTPAQGRTGNSPLKVLQPCPDPGGWPPLRCPVGPDSAPGALPSLCWDLPWAAAATLTASAPAAASLVPQHPGPAALLTARVDRSSGLFPGSHCRPLQPPSGCTPQRAMISHVCPAFQFALSVPWQVVSVGTLAAHRCDAEAGMKEASPGHPAGPQNGPHPPGSGHPGPQHKPTAFAPHCCKPCLVTTCPRPGHWAWLCLRPPRGHVVWVTRRGRGQGHLCGQ